MSYCKSLDKYKHFIYLFHSIFFSFRDDLTWLHITDERAGYRLTEENHCSVTGPFQIWAKPPWSALAPEPTTAQTGRVKENCTFTLVKMIYSVGTKGLLNRIWKMCHFPPGWNWLYLDEENPPAVASCSRTTWEDAGALWRPRQLFLNDWRPPLDSPQSYNMLLKRLTFSRVETLRTEHWRRSAGRGWDQLPPSLLLVAWYLENTSIVIRVCIFHNK